MSKIDLVDSYVTLRAYSQRLEHQLAQHSKQQNDIMQVERDVERVLKNEEEARAAYARRMQARTEAEDRWARMKKHEPGVSFLGYKSPARRRLFGMRKAVTEHARAAQVAQERQELAVLAAKRARDHMAAARARLTRWQKEQSVHIDARAADLEQSALQDRMTSLLNSISEADIDEAIMFNRISRDEAQIIRHASRSRFREAVER